MAFVYRGLTAQLDRHTVTDSEVDHQLQRLLQQNPRIAAVTDRPTENGDEVVLDYAGYCDGVQFPGGTAEMQTLTLGSGAFIPGFEEQLLDKVPGEEVTVTVTFPTQYHAEDLAGKKAEFHCKIHEIRVKTPYVLDDTFAKEVGGCETLADMRKKMKESLQSYTDQRGEMDLQDRLLRQAAETLEFTADPNALEDEVEQQLQTLQAQLSRQGLTLDMYCSFTNTTPKELHDDLYPAAQSALRMQATIDKIVELEHLEATKEEIGEALALICRQNEMTLEELKPHYEATLEQAVIRNVLTTKVMQLIRNQANIQETNS